jgi:hypothetical protein
MAVYGIKGWRPIPQGTVGFAECSFFRAGGSPRLRGVRAARQRLRHSRPGSMKGGRHTVLPSPFHVTGDPDGVRGCMQCLPAGYFPVRAPHDGAEVWNGKIAWDSWSDLVEWYRTESLRQVAKAYDVSHEAVRRTLPKRDRLVMGSPRWRMSTAPVVEARGRSCELLPFPVPRLRLRAQAHSQLRCPSSFRAYRLLLLKVGERSLCG